MKTQMANMIDPSGVEIRFVSSKGVVSTGSEVESEGVGVVGWSGGR